MLSKLGARETPYLARNSLFKKCTFFMRERGAWLGLHGGGKRALKSYNEAQDPTPSSPKI